MRAAWLVLAACASAPQPAIEVLPRSNSGIDGVQEDTAIIELQVRDRKLHEIGVTRLELVGCTGKRERLTITELQLSTWRSLDVVSRGARVFIPVAPAQGWSLSVKFPAFVAGACDDAYEADIVIDGVQRTYSIPLDVSIEESEE
jgi:hypothetical protein